MVLYVRVAGDAGAVQARVREEVLRLDPTLPLFDIHTLQEEMDAALVQQRLIALLSTLFGVLALLLASVGLYGLLAFGVVQRRRELGIRLALGAGRLSVVWLVLREAMGLAVVGVAIGLPLAFAGARLAEAASPASCSVSRPPIRRRSPARRCSCSSSRLWQPTCRRAARHRWIRW